MGVASRTCEIRRHGPSLREHAQIAQIGAETDPARAPAQREIGSRHSGVVRIRAGQLAFASRIDPGDFPHDVSLCQYSTIHASWIETRLTRHDPSWDGWAARAMQAISFAISPSFSLHIIEVSVDQGRSVVRHRLGAKDEANLLGVQTNASAYCDAGDVMKVSERSHIPNVSIHRAR
jgi:hypothetical protein